MATALIAPAEDRRAAARRRPHETPWLDAALLRPGQDVRVIDLSSQGALLESAHRMRPGTRAELQLASGSTRRVVRARILRCIVSGISPIRYRGAVAFDEPFAIDQDGQGSG